MAIRYTQTVFALGKHLKREKRKQAKQKLPTCGWQLSA
jgi:hypothetical protein